MGREAGERDNAINWLEQVSLCLMSHDRHVVIGSMKEKKSIASTSPRTARS